MPQKDVLLYASLLHRELCLVTVICTQTSFHNQTHVFSVAASITWNVFMTLVFHVAHMSYFLVQYGLFLHGHDWL
jgi:hypothetical protein